MFRKDKRNKDDDSIVSIATSAISNVNDCAGDALDAFADKLIELQFDTTIQDFTREEGECFTELATTISSSVGSFDGSWIDADDEGPSIEVSPKGRKDVIVASHSVESTFFDVRTREVESVHIVKRRRRFFLLRK